MSRLEVSFKGPGGHGWVAYGKVPSANHALGRLVVKVPTGASAGDGDASVIVQAITAGRYQLLPQVKWSVFNLTLEFKNS